MNTKGIFCSTGNITSYPKFPDYKTILENGNKLKADGLELIIYPNGYDELDVIIDKFQRSKLNFPVIHADKDIGSLITKPNTLAYKKGMNILKLNCKVAEKLNTKLMVLHLWGLPLSDDKFERNIAAFGECLKTAADYGVTLAVETLPCRSFDSITNLKKLVHSYSETKVVLDLRMLSYEGLLWKALEAKWLWEKEFVIHMHINDYSGKVKASESLKTYLFPGEGDIDFSRFFKAIKELNYSGSLTLECAAISKDGIINYDKINNSLNYLRDNTIY